MKMFFFAMIFAQMTHAADFDKKVTVTGQCSVETSPDRGSITFVVTRLDRDAKVAIGKSTAIYEKLRAELKKSTAKDLELTSTEYNVQERKEWEKNKSVSKGYDARLGLRASTSDITALGSLIATAANLGVNETNSLNTYLSEGKLLSEKQKCLEMAAVNARAKASTLVTSLNAKLGKVLQITESGANPPSPPMPMERAMMKTSMANDGGPGIEAPKQTISQTIDVTFAIE